MQNPPTTPETKLGGKWRDAGRGNTTRLMEVMSQAAREHDLADTLADRLIGAARYMGFTDDEIEDALFSDDESSFVVFYHP